MESATGMRSVERIAMIAFGTSFPAPARGDDNTSKKLWQLKFEAAMPKRVTLGKEPNIENYWYLPFTLENEDDQDHSFFLEITAVSDKGPNLAHYRSIAH